MCEKVVQTSPFLLLTKDGDLYNALYNSIKEINSYELSILKQSKNGIAIGKLYEQYDELVIKSLLVNKWLLYEEEVWKTTNIDCLEIEICTHCNWRCKYCPVSLNPKKKEIMPMDIYNEIISKAEKYGKIKTIVLNSYNEPTIDCFFEERIKRLAQTNIKLQLHTNASNLSKEKIILLKESDVLSSICFNLPSIDKEIFEYMTGTANFKRTISNIDAAISYGLPVKFSIQGTKEELKQNLPFIKEKYGDLIDDNIDNWKTFDRAGILKNQYNQHVYINDSLYGLCYRVLNNMYLSVRGEAFICCNDYFQKETYGNILYYEIDELLNSKDAQSIRKKVFGQMESSNDFICRKCIDMKHTMILSYMSRAIRSSDK